MLALEYIRAIKKKGLQLKYRAIERVGAGYNDISYCDIMSASAIRCHYYENGKFASIPCNVEEIYSKIANDKYVLDINAEYRYLHTYALQNYFKIKNSFDSNTQISSLIEKAAKGSQSSKEFWDSLSSKTITSARIRRALLYSLFDVNEIDRTPRFTFLLGMDSLGQEKIKSIKKDESFSVITKHSDINNLEEKDRRLAEKQYEIDSLYNTLLLNQRAPSSAYKNKPVIK